VSNAGASAPTSDHELIGLIVERIGGVPSSVQRLHGGEVNFTYRVHTQTGDVVIRFPVDRLRGNEFPVEMWATRTAAAAGIPVARGLRVGEIAGVPFIVSEYIAPAEHPIDSPWTTLGSLALRIATLDLSDAPDSLFSRFGRHLGSAWSQHLRYNLQALRADDELAADGAYDSRLRDRISSAFEELDGRCFAFGLAHGDLAPRNLLSQGRGCPPVLLDWGAAKTGPTPWTEARRVFEWAFLDRSIAEDDYADFLAAVGLDRRTAESTLIAMTALHLVDVTRWAHDVRSDLYAEYVVSCRTGLNALYTP
jgi:aminoglycoside phosphotransferase (APT) family kinase protein